MLPTLVMLPGTLCDARVFRRQVRALRGVARLVMLGNRGLRDTATWPQQLLRRLPERFSVAGFSLGGIWALELLRQAPERIERIALLASNAQAGSAKGRRHAVAQRKTLRRQGAAAAVEKALPRYFHQAAHRRRHAPLVRAMALATPARAARAQFHWAGHRPEGHTALARFGGPLLVVSGARDPLCPPAWQRRICESQPAARWIALPRAGHFITLEAPTRVRDALHQWMRS